VCYSQFMVSFSSRIRYLLCLPGYVEKLVHGILTAGPTAPDSQLINAPMEPGKDAGLDQEREILKITPLDSKAALR
jgi:hypothetical protein